MTPPRIRRSNRTTHVQYQDGNTADIIATILYADTRAAADTKDFAPELQGDTDVETAHNTWRFLKQHIRYVRDVAGYEKVQSPAALWASRMGDCKSYSVFIGSILKNLGIPYAYRFTKYTGQDDWTHVYVVAHPQSKHPIIIDAVHSQFNEQVPYRAKKDITPGDIAGIGSIGHYSAPRNLTI